MFNHQGENEGCQEMNNLFPHIDTSFIEIHWQMLEIGNFNVCRSNFKNDIQAHWLDLTIIATANTAHVFITTNFKSAVGRVTAIICSKSLLNVLQTVPLVDYILHDLLTAVISHITKI